MKEKLLKTPQGAESIFLDEAYKHEKINEFINNIYTQWGYLPIKTPVFDYYENYENLLSTDSKKNCFRLMDRDGELLLLRNDITLFLAKQLSRVANKGEILRVHYADTILRHQSEIDISSNEFFQTGAELVGAKGIYGDLEAITLLHTIISELNLKETRIHLGSRSILDSILEKYNEIDSKEVITLINLRDRYKLSSYLENSMDSDCAKKITDLFMFIGTFTQFSKLIDDYREFFNENGVLESITYLLQIGENLTSAGIIDDFRFDLSEVANRDYYTGIVFKAYTKDADSAIASGGRYNQLISSFGKGIPSVGFSILSRKIEDKILDEKFNPPQNLELEEYISFGEVFKKAQELRKQGKTVTIKGEL